MRYIPLSDKNDHLLLTDLITNYIISSKPTLCTIVYDDPDHTGHKFGFYSEEYYSVLESLDECIYRIVSSTKEANIYDNTVFILTSDHGGSGKSHGGDTPEERYTPFIMWGKRVNPQGYIKCNLEQQDVASIMASLLNVNEPQQWKGNNHNLIK